MRFLTVVVRVVVRLAVAVLVAATVGLGASMPAQAATCATAHGVSVVVDFHQLGGGVQSACDAGGAGRTAYAQLKDVGHRLVDVQRQPGFICRIDGAPSADQDPCVNTPPPDAYWSLWWSDGKSGKWTYSSQGASSLKVPDGGYVGMSWQGSDTKAPPGVAPTAHPTQASSSPTSRPSSSPHPSSSPTHGPSSSTASVPSSWASSTASSTSGPGSDRTTAGGPGKGGQRTHRHAKPSKKAKQGSRGHTPNHTAAATPLRGVATAGSAETGSSGSGGLPGWVAPVAVAVLFVGSGAVVVARRRRSGGA